jgi:hypothetical protein
MSEKVTNKYELDLSQPLADLRKLQKSVEDFNEATQKSSASQRDLFAKSAQASEQYAKTLSAAVRESVKNAEANKAYASSVSDMATRMDRYGKSQKESIRNYQEVNQKLSEAKKKQADLAAEMQKTEKASSGLMGMLGKVGAGLGAFFAVDKILDVGRSIFNTTKEFQKFEAILTNTLGSKSAAQAALKRIQDFAANTPFSVSEITAEFIKLANRGIQPTNEQLTKIGDVASALGKPLGSVNEAILDISNTERWNELGIKVQSAGDKMTGTFKGVTVEVEKTEKGALAMIEQFGKLPGVAGGMAAVSKTIEGQTSNLNDNIEKLAGNIGNRFSGEISGAIKAANSFVEGLNELVDSSNSAASGFEKQKKAVEELTTNFTPLVARYDQLKSKSELSKEEQEELNTIIGKIGATVPTTISAFDEYGKALDINSEAAKRFVEEQKLILQAMNREAISEQGEALKALNTEIIKVQQTLSKGTITLDAGFGVRTEAKLTGDEIATLQAKLADLQGQKTGLEGYIDQLKGIKKEVVETGSSAEESAKKQKGLIESLQASISELQKLQQKATSVADTTGKNGEIIKGIDSLNKEIAQKEKELAALLGKGDEKTADDRKKRYEDLTKEIEKLETQVNKAKLDALEKSSKEYLDALLDSQMKEVDILEQNLVEKGKLTDKNFQLSREQQEQLGILRNAVIQNYYEGLEAAEQLGQDQIFALREEGYSKDLEGLERKYDKEIKAAENNKDLIVALEAAKSRELAALKLAEAERQIELDEQIAIAKINQKTLPQGTRGVSEADFEKDKQRQILQVQIEAASERLATITGLEGKEYEARREGLKAFIAGLQQEMQGMATTEFSLQKLLGLSDSEFEGLALVYNQANEMASEYFANQIAQSEAFIAQKDKEIQSAEANLDRQIELQKLGLASDIKGEEQRIASLKKQREQALADQRKAQRAQILLDSATQASSLITAGSKIMAATAAIPPPLGQILGGVAIGAMIAAFVASKAKALQAVNTSAPSFRGGGGLDLSGKKLMGPSHESGGLHLVNPNTGEKLAEFEGNEYLHIMNKKATAQYLPMLEAMNKGTFKPALNLRALSLDMSDLPRLTMNPNIVADINRLQARAEKAEKRHFNSQIEKRLQSVENLLKDISASSSKTANRKNKQFLTDGSVVEWDDTHTRKYNPRKE